MFNCPLHFSLCLYLPPANQRATSYQQLVLALSEQSVEYYPVDKMRIINFTMSYCLECSYSATLNTKLSCLMFAVLLRLLVKFLRKFRKFIKFIKFHCSDSSCAFGRTIIPNRLWNTWLPNKFYKQVSLKWCLTAETIYQILPTSSTSYLLLASTSQVAWP